MKIIVTSVLFIFHFFISCKEKNKNEINLSDEVITDLPDTSFWNQPISSYDTSDYVIQLKHMQEFYDVPGEFGHIAEGKDYGFESLSFIITNTHPNGGPPFHVHETEEAHVLHEGSIQYQMGDKIFSAKGPYIIRIPAGVPHTFINSGNKPLKLTAVFPSKHLSYSELGRNPLVIDTTIYHRHKHR